VLVDAAVDVAVEVRQQDTASAQPDDAHWRRRRVDGLRRLCGGVVMATVGVSDYVRGCRLLVDGVTARSDVIRRRRRFSRTAQLRPLQTSTLYAPSPSDRLQSHVGAIR